MKGNKWEDLSNKKPFLSETKRVFVLKKIVFWKIILLATITRFCKTVLTTKV